MTAIVNIWRLQKNWGTQLEWEELTEIWEMLITALRDTKKQLTVMAKIWKLQKNLGIELELEKLTQISEILKTA